MEDYAEIDFNVGNNKVDEIIMPNKSRSLRFIAIDLWFTTFKVIKLFSNQRSSNSVE